MINQSSWGKQGRVSCHMITIIMILTECKRLFLPFIVKYDLLPDVRALPFDSEAEALKYRTGLLGLYTKTEGLVFHVT